MFSDNFYQLDAVITVLPYKFYLFTVSLLISETALCSLSRTQIAHVWPSCYICPLDKSPQWLNTRSAEASQAGKASIYRANDTRIGKRWQFFLARSLFHRPHHLGAKLIFSVHTRIFQSCRRNCLNFVVVIVSESDFS